MNGSTTAISALIPTYQGLGLLRQHLPTVLQSLRDGDELIIVDDASQDGTVAWLRSFFNAQPEKPSHQPNQDKQLPTSFTIWRGEWRRQRISGAVLIVQNATNLRFGATVNRGAQLATKPVLFILNNDVAPEPMAVIKALAHFEQSTDEAPVFAVGCKEIEGSDAAGNEIIGGKNQLWFERGFFMHRRAEDFTSGATAWVSGGSGFFDRLMWLELGGFDQRYYPAYWEDIDVSMRARQRGWRTVFAADAVVYHHHETTHATVFGQHRMQSMSFRNGWRFTQRFARGWQRLQSWMWLPIHARHVYLNSWAGLRSLLIEYQWYWGMLAITLVAVGLRGYQLGVVPRGMTWDEAAVAYNGMSVVHYYRDEWLERLPISFRSFGDYKAPFAIYLNGLTTRLLGTSLTVVRLPYAVSGVMAVTGMMMLIRQQLERAEQMSVKQWRYLHQHFWSKNSWAWLGGWFLATEPWGLHFSRIGFESGIMMSLVIWGMYFLYDQQQADAWRQRWWRSLLAVGLLATSLYTYHSAKVAVPLLVIWWLLSELRWVWRSLRWVASMGVVGALMMVPLAHDTLFGLGGERFQQASVFARPGKSWLLTFFAHIGAHLTPQFLWLGQTIELRHGDGAWGVFLPTTILLVIGGLGAGWSWWRRGLLSSWWRLWVVWLLVGLVPAGLGIDAPHSNRALLALPGGIGLAVSGGIWATDWLRQQSLNRKLSGSKAEKDLLVKAVVGTWLAVAIACFLAYQAHYYRVFAAASTADFQEGYQEVFSYLIPLERGQHDGHEIERIIFSNAYGQPYIYALWYRQTSPYAFHGGSLINYEFKDQVTVGDLMRPHAVVVVTDEPDFEVERASRVIYGSDGSVRFKIFRTGGPGEVLRDDI